MTALERRCRWLLRAYPAWYRAERGDEMLGTLLEASTPNQSWPATHDARALILGGLRVRAWQHERQTAAASLRQAVLLAAVLDLAFWSAQDLRMWGYTFPPTMFAWMNLMIGLLTLAAMAGAWFGHRVVVVVVALVAVGLWVSQPPGDLLYTGGPPVLALTVLASLAALRARLPRAWTWLAGVWYLAFVLPPMFNATRPFGVWVAFAIVVGAIGWSVIDARLMLATTLVVAAIFGSAAVRFYAESGGQASAIPWDLWPWFTPALLGLVLAVVAIWRVRRQAVL